VKAPTPDQPADQNMRDGFAKFQIRTIGGTPEEFGAFLKGQWAYLGDALKDVAAQAK